MIEDFNFSATDFKEYLDTFVKQLFAILATAKEEDTQVKIINVFTSLIDRMYEHVSS